MSVLLENEFGRIELFEIAQGIQGARFIHQCGKGSLSLYGGQVLSWQPKNQRAVFWLSDTSQYSEGKAIRGGIPLCWPWFGGEVKLPSGELTQTSNHGFARQSQWQITETNITASAVEITLTLSGKNLSPLWPEAFELKQKLVFADEFKQQLTMKNLSGTPVSYTGALHSYFRVSNPQSTQVPALSESYFDDKLTNNVKQKTVLSHCKGPIDRIYHNSNIMRIVDQKWHREIAVVSEGCQQWVLWNPGADARNMADVHSNGENEFICLEAANTHWQEIAPHAKVTIGQTISIKSLS